MCCIKKIIMQLFFFTKQMWILYYYIIRTYMATNRKITKLTVNKSMRRNFFLSISASLLEHIIEHVFFSFHQTCYTRHEESIIITEPYAIAGLTRKRRRRRRRNWKLCVQSIRYWSVTGSRMHHRTSFTRA